MKTMHCLYDKGRFTSYYMSDLEEFMSNMEFLKVINTFNHLAEKFPPYVSKAASLCIVFSTLIALITIMAVVRYTNYIGIIVIIPILFFGVSILVVTCKHRRQKRFEKEISKLCSCLNATENVRGINFKLNFLTSDHHISTSPTPVYAVTIEFDERYNLSRFMGRPKSLPPPYSYSPVQIPANVYCSMQSKE